MPGKRRVYLLLVSSLVALLGCAATGRCGDSLPVFPGAEGFGTMTPAGRGGRIIKVTSHGDCGPGTLRSAIAAAGPRIIVFEVGGTIALDQAISIDEPFVTISGQTAPSPGITLKGAGIRIRTHDVLIQHLRIRVGDAPQGPPPAQRDGFEILGPSAFDVVIDHISVSWAIDENGSTWYPVRDVTINHSIISEGLNASLHPKGRHSKGFMVGDHARNVSLIGNLLAHNAERNPRIKGDSSVLLVSNVMYNSCGTHFMSIGSPSGPSLVSAIANVFINGPDSEGASRAMKVEGNAPAGTAVYLLNNRSPAPELKYSTSFDPRVASPPITLSPLVVPECGEVESSVLASAGARPLDRDWVDERIVQEVRQRTGRIIDSPNQVGGWRDLPKTFRPFPVPAHPGRDDDGDGYTNIEEILHRMAAELEGMPQSAALKSGYRPQK